MRRLKFIMCLGICFSISLFFSGCTSPGSYIKIEPENTEGVTRWPGGIYSPKLLPDITLENATKELAAVFGSVQRIDDNVGFKISGKMDINNPSNQANLIPYLKSVNAYMIVRDPNGEFKYMLSRSGISVRGDHISVNPAFNLFFADLVDRPISVQKIGAEDIRCSWPDVNWKVVDDTIAGKYGIMARPMYRRPYMVRCGSLISLFFKKQTDAEKVADALFTIQKGIEKILADRRKKLESLAPQYRELTIKPPVSEEQRKNIVLADMMTKRKDYTQAISFYVKVINLDPVSYPDAYSNLALLSAQMQRLNMAVYYMKLYLMLVPEGPDSRKAQDKTYEWEYMLKKQDETR
jgi:tetratricopeptide (TPR) repeat protein